MDKTRHRRQLSLVEGIGGEMVIFQFARVRGTLTPYGISNLLYEAQIIRGDAHGIALDHRLEKFRTNVKLIR